MKTSLIILFKNELEYATLTMRTVHDFLTEHQIDFELIAVDDSTDGTWELLNAFARTHNNVTVLQGDKPSGYGKAVTKGLTAARGDILIPFNGDMSDSLDNVLSYIRLIQNGYDMVFGSRFMSGAEVIDSPMVKERISQLSNRFLEILFHADCSDLTNSFKAYRRAVIAEVHPVSEGYHISMEIALKAIMRGYRYTTIPVNWTGRQYGRSKMSLLKVIPKYLSTALKIRYLY